MTPLPAEIVARRSVSYDALQQDGDDLYWIEGRQEGDVLVHWTPEEGVRVVRVGVASYVHEYGGGAYIAVSGEVWFCDAQTQRVICLGRDGTETPITPATEPADRYADLQLVRDRVVCVRERRAGIDTVNELVSVPADGSGPVEVIASGWDFYAFPRSSPDGRTLTWICWNAPQMPWDGTFLYRADLRTDGTLGAPQYLAGGTEESIFQPEWSPSGVLHFVTDRDGWWNLCSWRGGAAVPVLQGEEEHAVALWEFGYRTYTFLNPGTIAVLAQRGGRTVLRLLQEGRTRPCPDIPFTSIKPYIAGNPMRLAVIGANPKQLPAVHLIDIESGMCEALTAVHRWDDATEPQAWTIISRDGSPLNALVHQPAAGGELPLIVKAHPGPTSCAPLRLDLHTQFFVSRGYCVAEVDYRGSTGYGRAYRQALLGQWGTLDPHDCADIALHLAHEGIADSSRTVIWGASAGGYTALRALQLTDVFTAAIARSPIIDPATWQRTAPKFQAHHSDLLTGDAADPTEITKPVLLLHGEADPVTPVEETIRLSAELKTPHPLVIFKDEGHGLGKQTTIVEALAAELAFLNEPTAS
ncbi:peptidase [Acrocarpospora corrugata]|uniref:Peptidase n=1 Tax=Acrocarpospora corrugata TaxID=35763 RepID=A0A5M3W897_9ACTN|nr:prolyl oligopeptidase family serine peptidase [Acrocarpospora corrugata]GES03413.1 peptidase [Acrocarpospora corrugata]